MAGSRLIVHEDVRDEGWTVATGGVPKDDLGGLFVRPTVVLAEPDATIARHEVFGPVLTAYTFRDEEEAVRLANDTPYGLAGAVWTKDVHRAHRMASAIRAGTVWINAYRVVAPNMPFGGFGLSGIGRENGSARGRGVPGEQVGLRRADRRHPGPVQARVARCRQRPRAISIR